MWLVFLRKRGAHEWIEVNFTVVLVKIELNFKGMVDMNISDKERTIMSSPM